MSNSSNDTVIDRLNPDIYSLSAQQPQTSQANPQLSQARLTPPSSSHQQFSFRPQFQFSQPSQQLFPTCCNSHSQPGDIAEPAPTPNVTPMIHDDNLFQRFMNTFVQMTLNNQSDREERLLDKLDNIARNLSPIIFIRLTPIDAYTRLNWKNR